MYNNIKQCNNMQTIQKQYKKQYNKCIYTYIYTNKYIKQNKTYESINKRIYIYTYKSNNKYNDNKENTIHNNIKLHETL